MKTFVKRIFGAEWRIWAKMHTILYGYHAVVCTVDDIGNAHQNGHSGLFDK